MNEWIYFLSFIVTYHYLIINNFLNFNEIISLL